LVVRRSRVLRKNGPPSVSRGGRLSGRFLRLVSLGAHHRARGTLERELTPIIARVTSRYVTAGKRPAWDRENARARGPAKVELLVTP